MRYIVRRVSGFSKGECWEVANLVKTILKLEGYTENFQQKSSNFYLIKMRDASTQ